EHARGAPDLRATGLRPRPAPRLEPGPAPGRPEAAVLRADALTPALRHRARHKIWGCPQRPAQDVCSCSLSPQGNPVRIRNCPATVYLCVFAAFPAPAHGLQSEDLPTVRPAVRPGCSDVRASRNGPVDARRRARPVLPPALDEAPCRARE